MIYDSLARSLTDFFRRDVAAFYDLSEGDSYEGYPVLGRGSSRIVLALDETRVLKVQYRMKLYQNQREVSVWFGSNDLVKALLCPVLVWDTNYHWVVMERAKPVDWKLADDAAEVFESFLHTSDAYGENIGLLQNRVVLVDYGTEFQHKVENEDVLKAIKELELLAQKSLTPVDQSATLSLP